MTNHWVDIKNADLVLIMGGNAAEAHPCGFKWVTEAKAHNKARLIVVDPRFTRSASVADVYAPIRTGTDIVFLGGVISYLLANDKIQHEYVKNYTDFTFIVREDFAFNEGLYSGYNAEKHSYDKTTWDYEIGADGYVQDGPDARAPALRLSADEAALRALHARDGGARLRHAAGEVPADLRDDCLDRHPDARDDHHVRARLDAALGRLADDPRTAPWCSCCSATSASPAAA